MNTRQIPGRDKIGSLAPGKYKTFEGTEISIENCVKAKVKDLRVEGKTYQNLADNKDFTLDNSKITTSSDRQKLVVNSYNILKPNTKYTIIFTVVAINLGTLEKIEIQADAYAFNNSSNKTLTKLATTGTYKSIFQTGDSISGVTNGKGLVIKGIAPEWESNTNKNNSISIANIIILEGDYTNTDFPNNIDGIESVAERENNILSVKINDNTTPLNLPIPLRSLPNNVCDTIEGNKLVQRVGKVVLDGTENWSLRVSNDDFTVFNCDSLTIPKTSTDYFHSSSRMICGQFAPSKISSMDSTAITKEGICLRASGTGFILSISKNKLDTQNSAGFKSYLKSNPVTVTYELDSQIIHSLEIPSISTTKGTNIITTTNNIKPKLSMKVKVK